MSKKITIIFMKYLQFTIITVLLLLFKTSVYGQNTRVVESFYKIPLNSSKYDVTSFMESDLVDFSVKKTYKSDVFLDGIREAIKYEGVNFDQITLIFYKGTLYDKKLDIFYIDPKYKHIAEKEYRNIDKHIRSFFNILKSVESQSINFGEQDGNGITYFVKKDGNKFTRQSGLMFKRLFDSQGTYGYKIEYNVTDVSKTEYDINKLSKPGLD
ncbi:MULTISPECIES: hypothetical protein [Sphingobacterium]|uniref:hypothetical protein n=1 Tax=Sphingobacterium TaxID=28453 RepID=UPI00095FA914|nr:MULTISPECIES: hypothetical protein [Sphingobacterium]OJZ06001.1 MAG: hypothetical protein BGP15_24315 [Sphingobacterium sp. 40-24]HAF32831.1 hypothetical protein [Sphingobacterium sp.]